MMRRIGLTLVMGSLAVWGCTSLAGIDEFQVGGTGGTGGGDAGGGTGGTGGDAGGGTGGAGGCDGPDECPGDDLTCQWRTCENRVCATGYAAASTQCTESGEVCSGEGECVWNDGHSCATGEDCLHGHCQDGLCCDAACDGTCQSCDAIQTGLADGTCGPISAFDDPDTECAAAPALGCDGVDACASCTTAAPAIGGTCPVACTGDCQGDWCLFDCSDSGSCDGATIDCPDGWNCRVSCGLGNSCRDAIVNCAEGQACEILCAFDAHQCQRLTLNCPDHGPCSMDCQGGDTCVDAELMCGSSACVATCSGGDFPVLNDCPPSCPCTTCS